MFRVLGFGVQVSEGPLEQVLETMGVQSQISVTADIGAADAVLALRSKLKHNTWVRGMAKYRQLPIFAIKVRGREKRRNVGACFLVIFYGIPSERMGRDGRV